MPHTKYPGDRYPGHTVVHDTHCCAIAELDCLGKSESPLDALRTTAYELCGKLGGTFAAPRIVIFSGTVNTEKQPKVWVHGHDNRSYKNYAQDFADYIVANKLGTVISTEPVLNWTRNYVKAFMWTVDLKALVAHVQANGIDIGHQYVDASEIPIVEEDDDDIEDEDDDA